MQRKRSKAFFYTILTVLLCALLPCLTACGTRLPTPTGVNVDQLSLTLSWNPVSAAAYYTVRIEGNGQTQEADTGNNSYSLERLPLSEGVYTLRVRAIAGGANKAYADSAWSAAVSFTREHETGLSFRLIESNTAFEVSGAGEAQGAIAVPDTYRGLPVTRIGDGAFQNVSNITAVTLGANITEIGAQAFANCSGLEKIGFSERLISIGEEAFQLCIGLDEPLTLPESLTEIGAQAFEYCRKLPAVTFGSRLTTIGDSAFNGCSALREAVVPDNVHTLGSGAFSACSSLERISLGGGISTIGTDTFRRCTALTEISIGGNIVSVGDYAFAECTKLASVTLSDAVTSIGVQAFYGCTQLNSVTLGSGVQKIARQAFHQTALWNNNGPTYIGHWFLGTGSATASFTLRDDTIGLADEAFAGYDTFDVRLDLPASLKYIGEGAFSGSKTLTNVVLGGGVQAIGNKAFYNCTGLTAVILGALDESSATLGESALTSIGDEAFYGCTALTDVEIPESVSHIGMHAFRRSGLWNASSREVYAGNWLVECRDNDSYGPVSFADDTAGIADYALYNCDFITEAAIPESVAYIGRSAFYECGHLTDVTLPSRLSAIEDYTFYHCDNLAALYTRAFDEETGSAQRVAGLPQTLKRIGRSAFYKCALGSPASDGEYDELRIPDSVTEIGDYAFYGCGFTDGNGEDAQTMRGIDSLVIGSGVTKIGNYAFANMGSLKSAIVGDGVIEIGERAFYRCEQLADVLIGNSVAKIGERAFYGCKALTAVRLPDALTDLGDYAFYRCAALTEVTLGGAERIGDYAFFGCAALTDITLPRSLVSIGTQAFRNCAALESVLLYEGVTNIGAHAFYGCNALTVYAEGAQGDGWNARWNSSYRPVVWGCDISPDGYVVSFELTRTSVENFTIAAAPSAPVREGYAFLGWASEADGAAQYTMDELGSLPPGSTLYAVWEPAS